MTAETTFNELIATTDLGAETHVLVGLQPQPPGDDGEADDADTVRRLQMAAPLAAQFRELATDFLAKKKRANDLRLVEYDSGYKQDSNEVTWVKIEDSPSIDAFLDALPTNGVAPTLDPDDENIRRLRYYALKVRTTSNSPITFICAFGRSKELTQRNAVIATFTGHRFESLEDKSLIFEPRFAAVAYRDYVYIVKQGEFERLFDLGGELKVIGKQTLDEIKENVPIANFDAFEAMASGSLQALRKLRNIKLKGYIQDITIAAVRADIEEFGDNIRVKIVTEGGVEKLEFDADDPWALMDLLEDRFVKSPMTGRHYNANSKKELAT